MKQCEPQVVDTGNGLTVRYRGRRLYSTVDPLGAVRKRVAKTELSAETLVFVPGIGLGYGLEELLRRLPLSCHILCVEADERLMALAVESASLPRSEHLTIVRSADPDSVSAYLRRRVPIGTFRRVRSLRLSSGYHLSPTTYDAIVERLEQEIQQHWQNKIILVHMGRLWVRNIIENVPAVCRSEDLRSLRSAYPICVMGAGPSLETSLPLVRNLRDRMLLLAVDTAMPVLSECGIRPDLVLALEAQVANVADFLGQDVEGISLLCGMTSHPAAARLFPGRCYFFCSDFHPLRLLSRLEESGLRPSSVPALGSVGVVALHAALRITREPIFLAGLDFSYPGMRSHSRGAPFHRHLLDSSARLRPAEAIGYEAIARRPLLRVENDREGRLLTDLVLHSYARTARKLVEQEGRVYDLGSAGMVEGAVLVKDESEMRELAPERREPRFVVRSGVIDRIDRPRQWRRLVQAEERRLESGLELISSLLHAGEGSASEPHIDAETRNRLDGLDYLTYNLPDRNPENYADPAVLARMLEAGRSLLPLWERASERLEEMFG